MEDLVVVTQRQIPHLGVQVEAVQEELILQQPEVLEQLILEQAAVVAEEVRR